MTSMNSSGVQSSLNRTSALKISEEKVLKKPAGCCCESLTHEVRKNDREMKSTGLHWNVSFSNLHCLHYIYKSVNFTNLNTGENPQDRKR